MHHEDTKTRSAFRISRRILLTNDFKKKVQRRRMRRVVFEIRVGLRVFVPSWLKGVIFHFHPQKFGNFEMLALPDPLHEVGQFELAEELAAFGRVAGLVELHARITGAVAGDAGGGLFLSRGVDRLAQLPAVGALQRCGKILLGQFAKLLCILGVVGSAAGELGAVFAAHVQWEFNQQPHLGSTPHGTAGFGGVKLDQQIAERLVLAGSGDAGAKQAHDVGMCGRGIVFALLLAALQVRSQLKHRRRILRLGGVGADPAGGRFVLAIAVAHLAGEECRVEVGEGGHLHLLRVRQGFVASAQRAAVERIGLEPPLDGVIVADGRTARGRLRREHRSAAALPHRSGLASRAGASARAKGRTPY